MIRKTMLFALIAATLLAAGAACKKSAVTASPADKAVAEAKAIEDEAAAAAEEADKPAPKPEPKMNDALFVEITARSVLIREKLKDEPDKIDPEIDKVYEKFAVTAAEYADFKKALTPQREGELMRKVQDKIQTLEREFK